MRRYLDDGSTRRNNRNCGRQPGRRRSRDPDISSGSEKIRDLAKKYRTPEPGGAALTVKDAIEAYLQGKRGRDQHLRLTRHVLGDEAKIAADEIAFKPLSS